MRRQIVPVLSYTGFLGGIAFGYNLTGNISGTCPECGTVFEEKVTQP